MNNKRDILVLSASHKCSIDFKVRGLLQSRSVRTLKSGELRVRVGNKSLPVVSVGDHAPLRLFVRRGVSVPGV